MVPLALYFNLYTHLQPIIFMVGLAGTGNHVPFLCSTSNLRAIASHIAGLLVAIVKHVGSTGDVLAVSAQGRGWRVEQKLLGLRMPSFNRVSIGCVGVGGRADKGTRREACGSLQGAVLEMM